MGINVMSAADFMDRFGDKAVLVGRVEGIRVIIDGMSIPTKRIWEEGEHGVHVCRPRLREALEILDNDTVYYEIGAVPPPLYITDNIAYKAIRVPRMWCVFGNDLPVLIDTQYVVDATAEYEQLHTEKAEVSSTALSIGDYLDAVANHTPTAVLNTKLSELTLIDIINIFKAAVGAETTVPVPDGVCSSVEDIILTDSEYAEMMDFVDYTYGIEPRTSERNYAKLCKKYPAAQR